MAALLPGFECDIFISYRQKDNKGGKWVTEFINALKTELEAAFKEDISIYFDENPHTGISEHHDVDDSLKDKLKCLVFIPILSQTYCDPRSFAYEHEFKAFTKQAAQDHLGLKVKLNGGNVSSRVLPIRIHELEKDDVDQFESVTGSVLRPIDFIYKEVGVNRPLIASDSKLDNQNKTDFRNQVNKTANAVKEIITALRSPVNNSVAKPFTNYLNQKNPSKGTSRKNIVWGAFGLTILFVLIYGLSQFMGSLKQESETREKSIAILTSGVVSNDPEQESFSDGMMEEIVDHLYKINDLRVVPLSSSMNYRESKLSVKGIAKELGVAHLLYISVRKSESRIKISLRLFDALNDHPLWTESYEKKLTDVFTVQSEVAQSVASKLKVKISEEVMQRISAAPTGNTEAYTLYLHAHNLIFNEDYADKDLKATRLLEKVMEMDPEFAPAYADLASIWLFRGMYNGYLNSDEVSRDALPLLLKAINLDPNLADAHAYLALYFLWFKWDFKSADKEWSTVFKLSPATTLWNSQYMDFLMASGRFNELLESSIQNLKIDRTSRTSWSSLADSYFYLGQTDKAIETMREANELMPENEGMLLSFIGHKVWIEHYEEAEVYLNKLLSSYPNSKYPRILCLTAIILVKTHQAEQSRKFLEELIEKSKGGSVGSPSYYIAQVYTAMGNKDLAFQWLDKAYADHELEMYWLKVEPSFRPLHSDPRWSDLMDKMSFPE